MEKRSIQIICALSSFKKNVITISFFFNFLSFSEFHFLDAQQEIKRPVPKVKEIVRLLDEKQPYSSVRYTGYFVNILNNNHKDSERVQFNLWVENNSDHTLFLLKLYNKYGENLNPILRIDANVFLYNVVEKKIIPIRNQDLELSYYCDLSYEDILSRNLLIERYKAKFIKEDRQKGIPTYLFDLKTIFPNQPYPSRLVWVSAYDYHPLLWKYLDDNGDVFKTIEVKEFVHHKNKIIPTIISVNDFTKPKSVTEIYITEYVRDTLNVDNIQFLLKDLIP